MLILGIHPGGHDACACLFDDYRLLSAVALERLTRHKTDGGRIPVEAIEDCLRSAGRKASDVGAVMLGRGNYPSRYYKHLSGGRLIEAKVRQVIGREKHKNMERESMRYGRTDSAAMFDGPAFLSDLGLPPNAHLDFFNHHYAHALPTLFHTDWNDALLYTADGGGDNIQYSAHHFANGKLETLFGSDADLTRPMQVDSVGLAYGFATQALGFKINRHEGKLTGLAAYGKPALTPTFASHFHVTDDGQIASDFESNGAMRAFIEQAAQGVSREDVACSVQVLLEDLVLEAVGRLLKLHPARNLGVSGGVFANVRLNQNLAQELPLDEIFIYPAMSDQGLACGGVLQFLLKRDGLAHWLSQRYRLDTLYYGQDYGSDIDTLFRTDARFKQISSTPVETAADLLRDKKIVAIYTKGGEYGPRALGARTIMASPVDAEVNDILNERLSRSEFMPFAPVTTVEDAQTVFELKPSMLYAARFMTITCGVHPAWRDRIPAVVHVDGTARPQIISRDQNALYYDIIKGYKERTGIPVLVNTSFNVHEEPIVNRPSECARALADGRVDFIVTEQGVYGRA